MPGLFEELFSQNQAFDQSHAQFSRLMDALARKPMEGANIHTPAPITQRLYQGMMAPEAFAAGGGANAANAEAVPFGSLADPVSQGAFILAPGLQRGLGALRSAGSPPLRTGFARGERGSIDDLKREFLQRGGVESGEGQALRSKVTPRQYAADMKAFGASAKHMPQADDLTSLLIERPHYARFIEHAEASFNERDILHALNTKPELQAFIDNVHKLTTEPTKNTEEILGFLESHVSKNIPSLQYAEQAGYVEHMFSKQGFDVGYALTEHSQDRAIRAYLRRNRLD